MTRKELISQTRNYLFKGGFKVSIGGASSDILKCHNQHTENQLTIKLGAIGFHVTLCLNQQNTNGPMKHSHTASGSFIFYRDTKSLDDLAACIVRFMEDHR